MRLLFLSPHYDDAIYSCGGSIYEWVQQGHDVIIWTLMAGIPQPPLPDTPVMQDNHTRWQVGDNPVTIRRQEDQAAAAIIGVETRYADVLDCIYRTAHQTPLYATEESLWRHIHPDDPAPITLSQLTLPTVDFIYAPLGVGEHVDHLIVRDWALQLAQKSSFTVQFYVEYPYLRQPEAVKSAYDVLPIHLKSVRRSFSEEAMQNKIAAMSAYQSQIHSFWANESEIDAEVRRTFTYNAQFVEEFAQST